MTTTKETQMNPFPTIQEPTEEPSVYFASVTERDAERNPMADAYWVAREEEREEDAAEIWEKMLLPSVRRFRSGNEGTQLLGLTELWDMDYESEDKWTGFVASPGMGIAFGFYEAGKISAEVLGDIENILSYEIPVTLDEIPYTFSFCEGDVSLKKVA